MLRFFTIIINHGFYKIFLILNKQLYYSQNLILKTNGTSTLLSAIGKFFGVFIEDLNKWIPVLFILNLCCLLCCFFIKNIYLFILCRNLQGFISGIQTSIAIGSSAYKGKEGFANWHTISTFVSIFTIISLSIFSLNTVIVGLLSCATLGIFTKAEKKKVDTTISTNIMNLKVSIVFWINSILLGCFLGLALCVISQQQSILYEYFNFSLSKSIIFTILPFITSFLISICKYFHNRYVAIIFLILSFLITLNIYGFFIGVCSIYGLFAIWNPILNEEILFIEDVYVASTYTNVIRSIITSIITFFTLHIKFYYIPFYLLILILIDFLKIYYNKY